MVLKQRAEVLICIPSNEIDSIHPANKPGKKDEKQEVEECCDETADNVSYCLCAEA